MGTALVAKLPPAARPLWKEYVGYGYSKILTGESWKLFATPAFRSEVLSVTRTKANGERPSPRGRNTWPGRGLSPASIYCWGKTMSI
jgi:hypothetical protein